ncbi:MAG: substrate-binding domain-containing protein [Acidobacteria bacterium]|nr:substrate-binding domain-containing protein [Acidobacteriota bacterium]
MKPNRSERDDYLVDAVVRACDLLRAFQSETEKLTLKELVTRTGLTSSRAFRLLYTLERSGLVEKADAQRYRLRVKLLERPRYRIGYAGQTLESSFAVDVANGLRAEADRRRIELIELDNRMSASTAVRNAEQLIRQRVDLAIEFQTFASVAAEVASKFRAAGIPLIAIDIPHPGAVFFGADNFRAGQIAGQALGMWTERYWSGRAQQIVLLDIPAVGATTATRMDGVLAGLREALPRAAELPTVRLDCKGTEEGGAAAMRRALRPGVRTLVAAANDPAALGALEVIQESRQRELSVIVSQGASAEGRAELRNPGSRLIGSVAYFPESYGKGLIQLSLDLLEGRPTPPAVFTPHKLVTAQNVASLYPDDATSPVAVHSRQTA